MSGDLYAKFDPIIALRSEMDLSRADPLKVVIEEIISPTEGIVEGRRTLFAGTNNYMGMTFDPDTMAAAKEAIDRFGTGTTGSRKLNGNYSGHVALEKTLADYYGKSDCIVFSTGYLANLATISALAGKDDYILIDADNHASIYDACTFGKANTVRFKHNDVEDLEKRLRRLPPEAGKLVIVEGIYSMLGDQAPLAEICKVKDKYGATLLVDEAHSMGFCGATGRGMAQEQGCEDQVDIIVGTFSKSVGTVGGFAVSSHPKFDMLRFAARPYIFTASLPPSVVASAKVAIEKIEKADGKRATLWANARRMHAGLKALGLTMATETAESPIISVCLPSPELVTEFWGRLLEAGIYVNMSIPPATPNGLYLLRASLSAVHTEEQVDLIIEGFRKVSEAMRLNGGGGTIL